MYERVAQIETRLNYLQWQVNDLQRRMAAVEQSQWQQWGGGGASGSSADWAVAKVTSQINAATNTTVLGSGLVQRYTTLNGGVLGGLTGLDEACWSINQDKSVNTNATVPIRRSMGQWIVDTPSKCDDLI